MGEMGVPCGTLVAAPKSNVKLCGSKPTSHIALIWQYDRQCGKPPAPTNFKPLRNAGASPTESFWRAYFFVAEIIKKCFNRCVNGK